MVRATCGAPVTVTVSSNATSTVIRSPSMKAPSDLFPRPDSVTPATVGPAVSAAAFPLTVKSASFVTAWVPRPSAALLPAASRMVPPFRASAAAATLMPSGSASVETGV